MISNEEALKAQYFGNARGAMYGVVAIEWSRQLLKGQLPKLEKDSPEIYQMHKNADLVLQVIEEEEFKKVYENLKKAYNQW